MPGPGPCCILEVCCPPRRAAEALAEFLAEGAEAGADDPYNKIATRLLESFRLVPRDLDKVTLEGLDHELRAYLRARGLPLASEE